MKSDLPKSFKEGDEFTSWMVDAIFKEIWRWRRVQATDPILIDNADSDSTPIFSLGQGIGGLIPGTTGGGFGAGGSPASPTQVTTSATIYPAEKTTGYPSASAITVTNAYSIYSAAIAASKIAWYWQSPSTGNYYVVTADC